MLVALKNRESELRTTEQLFVTTASLADAK
jgi:hypothetical protein